MRKDWWDKTREETEDEATAMTIDRLAKNKADDDKFEAIKKFNREHPIVITETLVYQSEAEPEIVDPIIYNPVWYVLNYLAPDRKRSKRK